MNETTFELPFALETDLERTIADDPAWQQGVVWGKPRSGHMEGPIMYHIADVLANIDAQEPPAGERRRLRLIALIHDTFKYRVNEQRPKFGTNHHAYIARLFAQKYIDDPTLLNIIEWHDDAYNSWRLGAYKGRWEHAEERADALIQYLGASLSLYVRFFLADSHTASKDKRPPEWFLDLLRRKGLASAIPPKYA